MAAPTVIVAELWDGPMTLGPSPVPPLSPAQLDDIAVRLTPQNGGVKPVVRVVERFSFARSA